MRLIKQCGIIFTISFLGEFLHEFIPLPIPASIYGLILMFLALHFRIVGMGVSEELGGSVTLTVAVIIISGVLGNVFAPAICRLFRIKEPIAKGIAIGSASHAIGTAKAMEMGEVEGAMSSLSIAVSGLLTVIGASIFASFI